MNVVEETGSPESIFGTLGRLVPIIPLHVPELSSAVAFSIVNDPPAA